MTLLFIWALFTLAAAEGSCTLACLGIIAVAFGFKPTSTFFYFCAFFIKFKISCDILRLTTDKVCGHQLHILFLRQFLIGFAGVCPIRNYRNRLCVYFFLFEVIFHKLAVTAGIFLILVGQSLFPFHRCCPSPGIAPGFGRSLAVPGKRWCAGRIGNECQTSGTPASLHPTVR